MSVGTQRVGCCFIICSPGFCFSIFFFYFFFQYWMKTSKRTIRWMFQCWIDFTCWREFHLHSSVCCNLFHFSRCYNVTSAGENLTSRCVYNSLAVAKFYYLCDTHFATPPRRRNFVFFFLCVCIVPSAGLLWTNPLTVPEVHVCVLEETLQLSILSPINFELLF